MPRSRTRLFAAAALLLAVSAPAVAEAPVRKLVVIVHPRHPAAHLSELEIVELFTAEQQFWSGSVGVSLVLEPSDSAAAKAFTQKALRRTPEELDKQLAAKRYRGTLATVIIRAANAAAVVDQVASNPRAIGYVYSDEIDPRVRVVAEYFDR